MVFDKAYTNVRPRGVDLSLRGLLIALHHRMWVEWMGVVAFHLSGPSKDSKA